MSIPLLTDRFRVRILSNCGAQRGKIDRTPEFSIRPVVHGALKCTSRPARPYRRFQTLTQTLSGVALPDLPAPAASRLRSPGRRLDPPGAAAEPCRRPARALHDCIRMKVEAGDCARKLGPERLRAAAGRHNPPRESQYCTASSDDQSKRSDRS